MAPPSGPSGVFARFYEFERNFNGSVWIQWTRDHAEVPVFAISLYLFIVFYAPGLLQNRPALTLKWPFAVWNICLALFSVCGSVRTVPHLYEFITTKGLDYTAGAYTRPLLAEDKTFWSLNH
jgi:hypothetical protein